MTEPIKDWKERFRTEFKVFFDNVGRPLKTSYSGWNADDVEAFIEEVREEAYRQGLKDGIDNPMW